ncbi:aminotransferase class V-fold PLP-dependent enzyme [Saccharopolyspora gloriosae]|uniref:Glutamate/tyrosine decarboxylase-like PLP-dependent enzyme n=1 Tax=Saccharopolyspora gloriosae TaxID=455344 RepID=A0A840NFD2_9PSEU|nr:aminotransferase class V-fold PLP-dependent enzyme [Saccharopolyspora gloriosae]MBB5068795.1 glutamate/tyrosine decarboxylase-like PLP-dependent enzyme [Saccharopolyspora gloriosae]
MDLRAWAGRAVDEISGWQRGFGEVEPHPDAVVSDADFAVAFEELLGRLRDTYPFHHPRYLGQLIKPPHPAAVAGYLATMLLNPNNHALDGGPSTTALEREAVARLAAMLGMPDALGHLTTSGTVANLEGLFVARETRPGSAIAHSAHAHYSHARNCHLLGVRSVPVPVDRLGRMDLAELEVLLGREDIGTVVLTAGTTSLGAVDQIDEVLELRRRHGFRIHVDAACGGFFALIADDAPDGVASAPFRALAECDSVVVDPHKHGLQPYGCGAVLFADRSVARFYRHDSPATYYTSAEPHLGEISLECSRSGAPAAALWLTFRLLPPTPDGLGRVLRAGRRAALRWTELLAESPVLSAYQRPELDIVAVLPEAPDMSTVDQRTTWMLHEGMRGGGAYLAALEVSAAELRARGHPVREDAPGARILRSVLLKPEHEHWIGRCHDEIEDLARRAAG